MASCMFPYYTYLLNNNKSQNLKQISQRKHEEEKNKQTENRSDIGRWTPENSEESFSEKRERKNKEGRTWS